MCLPLVWCRLSVVLGSVPLVHSIKLLGLDRWRTRRFATEPAWLFARGGGLLLQDVSNELAGLCALLGGSQSHDVTLNAMQVLQVQQAMAAQAAAKQKV